LCATAFAGIAALAVPLHPARAWWCDNCETTWQAAEEAAQQLQQLVQQVETLQQQYEMLMNTYQALTHVTDLGSAVSALRTLGIQNPLPVDPWAVQQLLSGRGSLSGIGGSLGSLFNRNYGANHIYTPTGDSALARQIEQNGNSIAGAQAVAQQLYQAVANRIPLMQQLEDRLNTARDPKDVMDLQARLAAEQSFIQSQQVQAQALTTWYAAQVRSERQQFEEQRQKDIDEVIAADPG